MKIETITRKAAKYALAFTCDSDNEIGSFSVDYSPDGDFAEPVGRQRLNLMLKAA